jgi:hypothetical protein
MRAWYGYWATFVITVGIWLGALVIGGRDGLRSVLASPLGLAILVLPIVVAGVNLVVYDRATKRSAGSRSRGIDRCGSLPAMAIPRPPSPSPA